RRGPPRVRCASGSQRERNRRDVSGQRKAAPSRRKSTRTGAETPLRRRVKKVLKWTGITSLVLAIIAVLGFVVLYRAIDIPDPNADFQTETTYVYYSDGKTELG